MLGKFRAIIEILTNRNFFCWKFALSVGILSEICSVHWEIANSCLVQWVFAILYTLSTETSELCFCKYSDTCGSIPTVWIRLSWLLVHSTKLLYFVYLPSSLVLASKTTGLALALASKIIGLGLENADLNPIPCHKTDLNYSLNHLQLKSANFGTEWISCCCWCV